MNCWSLSDWFITLVMITQMRGTNRYQQYEAQSRLCKQAATTDRVSSTLRHAVHSMTSRLELQSTRRAPGRMYLAKSHHASACDACHDSTQAWQSGPETSRPVATGLRRSLAFCQRRPHVRNSGRLPTSCACRRLLEQGSSCPHGWGLKELRMRQCLMVSALNIIHYGNSEAPNNPPLRTS